MGNLLTRGLVGLLAAFFLTVVQAETVPATKETTASVYRHYISAGQFSGKMTPQEVCSFCGNPSNCYVGSYGPTSVPTSGVGVYQYCFNRGDSENKQVGWWDAACPSGYANVNGVCERYVCPDSSWTLSGSTCSRPDCGSGYERNAQGQCVKDCTGKQGMQTVNGSYRFTGPVSEWSVSECKVKCNTRILFAEGGTGSECSFTGASAAPDNPEAEALPPDPEKVPPEKPEDCLGTGQGYIQTSSGVTCVKASDAPAGQKPTGVEQDKTKVTGTDSNGNGQPDPGEPGYKKEETSTNVGPGGATSTTKTTINATEDPANPTGSKICPEGYTKNTDDTCSKVTVTKTGTSDFCAENPTAAACKSKESSFGGACESGFTCDGDAATCAIAKASWEQRCIFREDGSTGLYDPANPGGTGDMLNRAEAALNKTGNSDFNIANAFLENNRAYITYSSSCPVGNQTFTVGRATIELKAEIVCQLGFFIKLMIHLVAYLALIRLFSAKLV